jgi:hypothetical protein
VRLFFLGFGFFVTSQKVLVNFWIRAFAGMTIQNYYLILNVIPAKAGIQVNPHLNQLPELFEKLRFFKKNILKAIKNMCLDHIEKRPVSNTAFT